VQGVSLVTWAVVAVGLFALVGYALRRRARRQRHDQERGALLAMAHTWGVDVAPGESTAGLRRRVAAVADAHMTADPIETAARALRNQRRRRERRSEPGQRSAKRA
jgi:hypothetical protein